MSDLTAEQMAAALRAQAEGSYEAEASVELLIRHGEPGGQGWLHRPEFRDCIDVGVAVTDPDLLMAAVDWDQVDEANLPGSTSALDILNVARALAGEVILDPLCMVGLDATNRTLVLRAVLHAAAGQTAPPVVVHPFQLRS